ncbi:MAG: proteasome assembly chaperone family protein [archaeon]|nr:MAG: proteasome assembly chaperone family protein [archaeon]
MLDIKLEKRPAERCTIIEGFPGFGFVSTIATEFLIKHLDAKPIGKITSQKLDPVAAIHKNEILNPLQIFYSKKNNIVIVQALVPVDGLEWEIAETVAELAKKIKAKEIISLEGVSSQTGIKNPQVFFYTSLKDKRKHMVNLKLPPLEEGIIVGVTGALLMKTGVPLSCFFVETHSKLPDNNGAANLIKTLDNYLGLNVDYHPLIEKAKEFESKIKNVLSQLNATKDQKQQKDLAYMG